MLIIKTKHKSEWGEGVGFTRVFVFKCLICVPKEIPFLNHHANKICYLINSMSLNIFFYIELHKY